jgi:hypothetical protein
MIRYADDFVMGFERREDAERVLAMLHLRMADYGLTLHPDKTRLIDLLPDAGKPRVHAKVIQLPLPRFARANEHFETRPAGQEQGGES